MRVGIGISEDLRIDVQQDLARDIEGAGFTSLWSNEATGRDALLVCQAWGAVTDRLEVGVGVLPIWTRSASQVAMASATLSEATGGRFLLGLGVSHPATMQPWHGADYRTPLTAARETLEVLERLEAGETADVAGDVVRSQRFRLAIDPPPPPTRRYLAAMGPRMLALAGKRADGVLLNWSSPAEVARAAGAVREAATTTGRDAADVEVATYVRVAVAEDRGAARAALAREIASYAALPAYAAHFERQGHGDVVTALKDAHKRGGPEAVGGVLDDDTLLDLGWFATPDDDPSAMLARYAEAGLDHLVARVVVTGDDPVSSVHAVCDALTG